MLSQSRSSRSSLSAKYIMANSTFLPPGNVADSHLAPNPYPNSLLQNYMVDQSYSSSYFPAGCELSDYLAFDDHQPISEDSISSFTPSASILQTPIASHDMTSSGSSASASSFDGIPMIRHMQTECNKGKTPEGNIVAFRTRTELESLDDGYKWRKYGKKMVKSNPYPRNYYKCSSVGCKVKKRIERDREDSSYLLTTYEGVHNHERPCVIFCNELPFSLSCGWSGQPSRPSS